MSIQDFSSSGKTVQTEAIRLTEMVIKKQVLDKAIDAARADVFFKRITDLLHTIYNDDLLTLLEMEKIEAAINCKTCGGSGVQVIVNGFDAGDYAVATETTRQTCPCCGG